MTEEAANEANVEVAPVDLEELAERLEALEARVTKLEAAVGRQDYDVQGEGALEE